MKARLLCLVFCLLATCGTIGASSADIYDGQWWLSIDKRQRISFLNGYVTCAINLAKLDVRFNESVLTYVPRITAYLQEHPEASKESVETLLWKVASPPYSHPVEDTGKGEDWGKWGPMDGDEWRNAVRDMLLQGFLECYKKRTNQEHGTFSKPVEYYVGAISKWYKIDPNDPGKIDVHRSDTKVPEVLFQFRDKKVKEPAKLDFSGPHHP